MRDVDSIRKRLVGRGFSDHSFVNALENAVRLTMEAQRTHTAPCALFFDKEERLLIRLSDLVDLARAITIRPQLGRRFPQQLPLG